jgi:hypothetical protein
MIEIDSRLLLLIEFCNFCTSSDQSRTLDSILYDNMVYLIVARLLQSRAFHSAQHFLLSILKVPRNCISLLTILFHSGAKNTTKDNPTSKNFRDQCLVLIGNLVFAKDEKISNLSLNYLLWSSVNDNFELRSRVITLIFT